MLHIPSERKRLVVWVKELIEQCRASSGGRTEDYRTIATLVETGTDDQATRSRMNLLYHHLRRTEAHLFSPIQLQFSLDFTNEYPPEVYERAQSVGRMLTRGWKLNNTDRVFGQGVFEALKYGACFLKQWSEDRGVGKPPVMRRKLVMPWQFAVYTENLNELDEQDAMVETTWLTLPQVWQRIHHLPGAEKLFLQIKANAQRGISADDPSNFLGHILSTNPINTTGELASNPSPGGVALIGTASMPLRNAELDVDLVQFHEIWVKGPEDYITIQFIDPDILIMPYFAGDIMTRKTNALIPGKVNSGLHPYTLIQPTKVSGNLWGRSEIVDLIEPQVMITQTANDARRLFGLQVDKYLAFSGIDGVTDESYDAMRSAGFFNMGQTGKVEDITPQFPPETLNYMKMLIDNFNIIGGFPSLMQGEGESGVRSGVQASTLLKTGSPRLRDMSLAVERDCAAACQLTLELKAAKDPSRYWTNGKTAADAKKTAFILEDLPDDRRVTVDSHSSSPIFMDDHEQLVAFGAKMGWLDAEDGIRMMPFPNQELLISHYKEKQEASQKKLEETIQKAMTFAPEKAAETMLKMVSGGKK